MLEVCPWRARVSVGSFAVACATASAVPSAARSDAEFEQALQQAAQETLKTMAERQIVIAEFRASATDLPKTYVDTDIEETIRRDFGGDRNRFVASLRAAARFPSRDIR